MPFDLKTLILMNFVSNMVALVTMGMLLAQYRRRYAGLTQWLANIVMQAVAIVLLVLRGKIPDFASMVIANVMVQAGLWLILNGLRSFFGKPGKLWQNGAMLLAFTVAFSYWALVEPDLNARNLLVSGCMAITMAQIAWFALVRLAKSGGSAVRFTGLIALCNMIVNIARFAYHLIYPDPRNDFFHAPGILDTMAILAYITLALLLVLAMVLLINQRLMADVLAQEEKFSKAFHAAPYAVILTRMDDGRIFEINRGFEKITGFERGDAIGKTTSELSLWQSNENRIELLASLKRDGEIRDRELEVRRRDGSLVPCVISAETIMIAGDRCIIACIGDETEQVRLRERLKELAQHDALTGLPNRRLFYDRFEVALANAARNRIKLAVATLDLDHFKDINDAYGHEIGDLVLTEASRRLTSSLRRIDTVARFGGDEFVLLLWEIQKPSDAEEVAAKVLAAFRLPFAPHGKPLSFNASIGIAIYPEDGTDLTTLLRKSDEALYHVKAHGRDGFRLASET
jgi:diguanylate cyclase (GGDEF)-like protein/PAS domain S-box-containing protein